MSKSSYELRLGASREKDASRASIYGVLGRGEDQLRDRFKSKNRVLRARRKWAECTEKARHVSHPILPNAALSSLTDSLRTADLLLYSFRNAALQKTLSLVGGKNEQEMRNMEGKRSSFPYFIAYYVHFRQCTFLSKRLRETRAGGWR